VDAVLAQRQDAFQMSRDHPAIAYSTHDANTVVSQLNRKIDNGDLRLARDGAGGYLRSVLEALSVPVESQVVVFSPTSSQSSRISPTNPRAVFFGDTVAVGWVRGGAVLEIAAQDPEQGVIFYSLAQEAADRPQFKRNDECLACHLSWDTLAVPGLQVFSTQPLPDDKNAYAVGFASNHAVPLEQRWGGWYVTGRAGSVTHQGNIVSAERSPQAAVGTGPRHELKSLDGQFDLDGFPSHYSDVVALMVLEHQAHMTNLITRTGWEARLASYEEHAANSGSPQKPGGHAAGAARVGDAARDLVDYLLFVDEAPLAGRIEGSSGFAETFAAQGPRDQKGRSLRQLDLEHTLTKYPCSYMIDTAAFDALPVSAKEAVYQRMWQVLSGREPQKKYARLSLADRQAVVEILRDTKKDLPEYFQPLTR
jgi:hypothetical protein